MFNIELIFTPYAFAHISQNLGFSFPKFKQKSETKSFSIFLLILTPNVFFHLKVKKISFFYIRGLFSGRNGVEGMRKHYPVEIYYYNFSHSVSICPPCSFRIYPGEWPRMTIRPSVGHLEQQYLRETISDILHINIILVACKLLGALQAKPCMRSRSTDNICEISLYTKY